MKVLKSSLTGFFACLLFTYFAIISANFVLEVFLFYMYPDFHVYTDPEPAETLVQAAQNAKEETIQVVTRKPIQFAVVSIILGIGVFIFVYGPWES